MLDLINEKFNKLSKIDVFSEKNIAIGYDEKNKIISLDESDDSKVIANNIYNFAEILVSRNVQINDLKQISDTAYEIV